MPYQALARKYRPQRFEDVIGQPGVTTTLRNALTQGRIAQAFVFAGPRGVGKTTTARILARALNCAAGPTPDPCGTCDACVEIAGGRDIDVLEIDAATHTQVDNVREVIIAGLAIAPVRDRYKIFIIDEVHQLSSHSFNALLKSVEEPPPHVVFMMATTQKEKIPDTILSRSQVHDLRTITRRQIAEQLRRIADAESIAIDEAALGLVARAGEGSLRDAESALDQVIAFAGETVGVDDVSTVLGLIGRDPVLDAVAAVADEDAAAVFTLAGRFVEAGYDLRLVCRELLRVVRDLLVLAIDPARIEDPEIAGDGDRERLAALAPRFSREDLLRAFDVVSRTEVEIRSAPQPRYALEMALLRWMHLQQLAPLTDLLQGRAVPPRAAARSAPPRAAAPAPAASVPRAAPAPPQAAPRPAPPPPAGAAARASDPGPSPAAGPSSARPPAAAAPPPDDSPAAIASLPSGTGAAPAGSARPSAPSEADAAAAPLLPASAAPSSSPAASPPAPPASSDQGGDAGAALVGAPVPPPVPPVSSAGADDAALAALLAAIREEKRFFHGTVVAQAQRVELAGDRLLFSFSPEQDTLRRQFQVNRAWVETVAAQVFGRPVAVEAAGPGAGEDGAARSGAAAADGGAGAGAAPAGDPDARLRQRALGDPVVKTMLDLFPADITDVEKIR